MSFDITNCVQTKLWFESQNTKIYESLKDRPKLARIGALGLGMSQALITLVAKVTNIGEVVIKGLANIFGAPFHGKCSALRGLKLLGLTLPIEILSSIFTVGLALKQLLIDPALAFKNPKEFIEQQIQMHQKTEEVWLFVAYAEKPGISSFEDFCLSSLITIYGSNGENDLAPIDDSAVKREELEAGLYDL